MDKRTQIYYAAKTFLKKNITEDPHRLESLKKEISISQKLNHKNVVKYEEVHETENSIYLVYEYLQGPPIYKTSIPLTIKTQKIRKIMFSLLQAMKYLKDQNIVHRDLKPGNILFKEKSNFSSIKILDFGLSCSRFEKINSPKICGTPGFMAPEIFHTHANEAWKIIDSNLDIFSAGVLFHYFLFGRLIYKEDKFDPEIAYENNRKRLGRVGNFREMRRELKSKESAYDLMRGMVKKDYTKRITIEEALIHPFFTTGLEDFIDDLDIGEEPKVDIGRKMRLKKFVCKDNKKLFSQVLGKKKNCDKTGITEDPTPTASKLGLSQ